MNILDRYILRQFVTTFLFAILAFVSLFILIDLIERLDEFVDRKSSVLIIGEYYLYFLPEIIKLITPMATLLASLYVTGQLTKQTELTAMKSGGISLYRMLVPFYVATLLIMAIDFYFSGWVVPAATRAKADFEAKRLGKGQASGSRSNLNTQESPNRMVTMSYFDDESRTCYNVSIETFEGKTLQSRLDAERMVYNDSLKQWVLYNVYGRTLEKRLVDSLSVFAQPDTITLSFSAADLRENNAALDQLTLPQHRRFLISKEQSGFDALGEASVKYHTKISFPFACLVVVLIGVPLSSVKKRSGLALEAGISLLLGFGYIGVQQVFATLGYKDELPPLVAAWLPNVIFLAAGIGLLWKVQK
ncbi:MAG: LPS export ABC transporter permease LptG [Rhizobacter sp.]|nr:LPS export ABC transporter permease LptG [Chlorobiales bacterium]